MSWYVAASLNKLLDQLNKRAPNRSKASDGSIGDASHSARYSDHNPTITGQVCARDFTHDPAGGLDGNWLANTLVASRDSRIKYVIWNRRIIDSRAGQHPWQWMPYTGTNPHDHHVHVSVFAGTVGNDARAWNLGPAPEKDWLDMTPQQLEDAMVAALARFNASDEFRWPEGGRNPADNMTQQTLSQLGIQGQLDTVIAALNSLTTMLGQLLEQQATGSGE